MVATLERMARVKKDPTEQVRLPVRIVRKAKMIAAHRDKSVPEYLAEIVESIIDRDYDEMAKELAAGRREKR